MRKVITLISFVGLMTTGFGAWAPAAQAADTGNPAPQSGRIVSDEPGQNAPNILDGTVYSIAQVGNTIVVGGQFSQAQNYNTSTTVTRNNVLAFDATTGKLLTAFTPNPSGTVYKVLPAADGQSVYVAGEFTSAAGKSVPGRVFKINVTTGVVNTSFVAPTVDGKIRDLEVVGNHLFVSGKFTHIGGVGQKALGTLYADTGKRDPYVDNVFAGVRNTLQGAVTDVLQISINPQNTELMAVGNFTGVDGQIAFPDRPPRHREHPERHQHERPLEPVALVDDCSTPPPCAARFDTYMTDVEYSRDGSYFVVSTTGAYGGAAASNAGTSGATWWRGSRTTRLRRSMPSWTAYTGSDTTWTVEVTDRRRLRRRPPEVPEQPGRQQHRRPRSGQPRRHRRAEPGQRHAVLVEPDPHPRRRGPGHAGHVRRALRRIGHRPRSDTRPATRTTRGSPSCRSPAARRCRSPSPRRCRSTSTASPRGLHS